MSINETRFDEDPTDDEIVDFLKRSTVPFLKVAVTVIVWAASFALLKFGFTSIFYACLAGLMACFGTWRRYVQPTTLIMFVAAVAYAVWAR